MPTVQIPSGCITAIVTPFVLSGRGIDWDGLGLNIAFQISQGVRGIVPVGTTGESTTLTQKQHERVLAFASGAAASRIFVLAGCGSNSTAEALHYTRFAWQIMCQGVLLVDPYYNRPSSLEIAQEYYSAIAAEFPGLEIVPYIIPSRTGTALSVADLVNLANRDANIVAVKEATGDLRRMAEIRRLAPVGFKIFSGDDDLTFVMMNNPDIKANGVISVIANVAPSAVQRMCEALFRRDTEDARRIRAALNPLFRLVTVIERRAVPVSGSDEIFVVEDRFSNPDSVKTMMQGLGMPSGPCRRPLGKMTAGAVAQIRNALLEVWRNNPWILEPIQDFYGVNITQRLEDDEIWRALAR